MESRILGVPFFSASIFHNRRDKNSISEKKDRIVDLFFSGKKKKKKKERRKEEIEIKEERKRNADPMHNGRCDLKNRWKF